MNFLEKLDFLMDRNKLNKRTLSKACGIPYTTIDGWYKKGYEGMKLTTLCKLASFFDTSLDFWASDQPFEDTMIDEKIRWFVKQYRLLSDEDRDLIKHMIRSLSGKNGEQQADGNEQE